MSEAKKNIIVGAIPARSGSKRIKNKNLQNLKGLPLIDHTINFANSLPINKCYLTTDSLEIAERAQGKVKAPFLRPKNISDDASSDIDWLAHLISYLSETEKYIPTFVLILRPTSPIRSLRHVLDAFELAINSKLSVRSACKIPTKMSLPWVICPRGQNFQNVEQDGFLVRSQDIPSYYYPTGLYDIVHVETFLSTGKIYGNEFKLLIHDERLINDIDTIEAKKFYRKYHGGSKKKKRKKSKNVAKLLLDPEIKSYKPPTTEEKEHVPKSYKPKIK